MFPSDHLARAYQQQLLDAAETDMPRQKLPVGRLAATWNRFLLFLGNRLINLGERVRCSAYAHLPGQEGCV